MITYNKYKAYLPDGSTKILRKSSDAKITGCYAYFYKGKWDASLVVKSKWAAPSIDEVWAHISFYNDFHNQSSEYPAQSIRFELIAN